MNKRCDNVIDTLNLLVRLDATQGKDLHEIVRTALEVFLELAKATQISLMVEVDRERYPVIATLEASVNVPDFLDPQMVFDDLPQIRDEDMGFELIDTHCSLKCSFAGTRASDCEPVVERFLHRLASLISHYCLQQELQRNTNEMHRLRLNLEHSINSIPDAIVTVSEDLRVLTTNEAFLRLFGGIASDYKNHTLEECFGDLATPYTNVIKQTLELGRLTSHFRVTTKTPEGKDCKLELNAAPLRTGDYSFGGVVLVIKDLTRLAVLEQQLEDRKLLNNMVGKCAAMQHVASLVHSLSDLETTVLITGESGTGKELVADALHYSGIRAEKKIVKVNCAALSESLLESELFGHVRGAFTGATKESRGRVAAAEGGTLFLDEIGDLPLSIQLKLLRFLEYKQYEQVGSSRARKADVRVVTATNADLVKKVREGTFRKDLYYRLNVFQIELPPLRERKEDIPLLAKSFLTTFNNELSRSIKSLSPEVMETFIQYDWPGNIRELRHCIEYAAILCSDEILTSVHLPKNFRANHSFECSSPFESEEQVQGVPTPPLTTDHHPPRGAFNAERVREALEQANWKKAGAARLLGISRPTLYRWMKRAGLTDV